MDVHFLAELPLEPAVRIGGDSGKPIVLEPGGEPFIELAKATAARAVEAASAGPSIEISE